MREKICTFLFVIFVITVSNFCFSVNADEGFEYYRGRVVVVKNIAQDSDFVTLEQKALYSCGIIQRIGWCFCNPKIEENHKVQLNAKYGLLKSELECEVIKNNKGCQIIRRQRYPGIIG